jgi:hypothetical protein
LFQIGDGALNFMAAVQHSSAAAIVLLLLVLVKRIIGASLHLQTAGFRSPFNGPPIFSEFALSLVKKQQYTFISDPFSEPNCRLPKID